MMISIKKLTLFLFCVAMIPQDLISQTGTKKHNILFISIDDFRPKINSYGESQMITPNIDKLASEGLQFDNAFTNIAVCGASRASIMTGIRPSQDRFNDYRSRASVDTPDAITLNQLFMENGYETISYGKIYHYPNDTGAYWSDNDGGAHQADYQDPEAQERKRNGEFGEHGRKGPAFEYPEVDDYAYNDGKVTKRALDKMKALKAEDKPFFMAVGYVSPHLPFIQPKKYWDLYDHNEVPLADNAYQPENSPYIAMHAQHDNAELRNMYLDIPSKGLLSDEMSRNLVHGYYASVSYMDALIGDLIDGLDAMGLRDNTTIILWSDHGFFLGEHGFWCKHSTFYEAIKIPFIISSPGFAKNQTTDSFTELVDVYPTLCELSGIRPPEYIHGESLTPVMENPSVNLKDEIYTRYKQGEAVVDENYSYTEFFQGEEYLGNMLYDLKLDLRQNTDISKLAENAALVDKYSKKLKVMRDFVNQDPLKAK
jgi:iduronate 2-sulfatase|tara:strand:+ start:236 stop:1684 length:1449 start_codon:yes stop_codon:yes gene_type:complete